MGISLLFGTWIFGFETMFLVVAAIFVLWLLVQLLRLFAPLLRWLSDNFFLLLGIYFGGVACLVFFTYLTR